jgi:hypothetical protein
VAHDLKIPGLRLLCQFVTVVAVGQYGQNPLVEFWQKLVVE